MSDDKAAASPGRSDHQRTDAADPAEAVARENAIDEVTDGDGVARFETDARDKDAG